MSSAVAMSSELRVRDEVQLGIVEAPLQDGHLQDDGFDSDSSSSISGSFFAPWSQSAMWRGPNGSGGSGHGARDDGGGYKTVEKRIIRIALLLAVLEKAASVLGKLAFVWATVVLLGGFASSLTALDFWSMASILFVEGTRVFSRGKELKWQQYSTRTPYAGWVLASRKAGVALSILQVLSSMACIALSVAGLCKHEYYGDGTDESRNQTWALVLFYSAALVAAAMLLLHKVYWMWKVLCHKLLDEVSSDSECERVPLIRFFYYAYSQCMSNSIFDGVKMDLITFAKELIESDFLDEQETGVCILRQFAWNRSSAAETLRKVGTSARSIERLVEMLNWESPREEKVRRCAAEVMSKLVGRSQNALRVAGVHGSIESVMSLLRTKRSVMTPRRRERHEADASAAEAASLASDSYDYMGFNLVGLLVLKKLARAHDNCGRIGSVPGLLSRIVKFTHVPPELLRRDVLEATQYNQIRAAKRSIQVLKLLVNATGNTGKKLRREVACRVFTVSNLRGILQDWQRDGAEAERPSTIELRRPWHEELQKLAIDVLAGLAMDDGAKEGIVGTGGVVKELLSLFQNDNRASDLRSRAVEALAMLALESSINCSAILLSMEGGVVDGLIAALGGDDTALWLNAARFLRNLCAYSGKEFSVRLRDVTAAMPLPTVLRMTMLESEKLLEASVGLTRQICIKSSLSAEQFAEKLSGAAVDAQAYVERLVDILKQYTPGHEEGSIRYTPLDTKVPRIRRFVVQQAVWLMEAHAAEYVGRFRVLHMESLLRSVADTTSDLECFHVFSGSVGLCQHRKSFSAILEKALKLLSGQSSRMR